MTREQFEGILQCLNLVDLNIIVVDMESQEYDLVVKTL
jgi:hypothetical protein